MTHSAANPAANGPQFAGSGTVERVVTCSSTMQRGQTPVPDESKIISVVGFATNVVMRPPMPNVSLETTAAMPAAFRVIDSFVP
jgi:hypothetical protein